MITSILYNEKDSFEEFGLKIENIINFPSSIAEYETINVDGRDGSLNIFNRYSDKDVSINFIFKAKDEEFYNKKPKILSWLNSKNGILIYSKNKGVYYKVKKIKINNFESTSRIVRRLTVIFTISPFDYLIEGNDVIELTTGTTLYNEKATTESKPYIKIYGSGDVNLFINNSTYVFKGITDFMEVDSEIMNCYKKVNGAITNYNNLMYSPFPILEVGENNISWTGNVVKVEIIPRWCCL